MAFIRPGVQRLALQTPEDRLLPEVSSVFVPLMSLRVECRAVPAQVTGGKLTYCSDPRFLSEGPQSLEGAASLGLRVPQAEEGCVIRKILGGGILLDRGRMWIETRLGRCSEDNRVEQSLG